MGISFWQIAIVVVLIVLLFGRGKISELMGDVAKGISSFKKGLKDDAEVIAAPDQEEGGDASMGVEESSGESSGEKTGEKTDA